MADIGLIGLPNAGKSTFLSVISNARPEIANYPFTTLTPQLGVATIDDQDLLIADIPGLIEGAADGKGLGHDFLRHVDRTAVLLHLVDIYNDDAGEAYRMIRGELERYSDLRDRPEIVALTKCEGVDPEIVEMQKQAILAVNPSARVFTISSQAHQGITELLRALLTEKRAHTRRQAEAQETPNSPATEETPTVREFAQIETPDDIQRVASNQNFDQLSSKENNLPVIQLGAEQLSKAWNIEKITTPDGEIKFIVTGPKIEKFARRTDLENYASVNRLRDIMKKMGIRAALTTLGAEPNSIISIADKEFTLVEDY